MLALSRKKGEALMINNDIEIIVLEIKGEQVKIGINAPKSVPVYRKEGYEMKARNETECQTPQWSSYAPKLILACISNPFESV